MDFACSPYDSQIIILPQCKDMSCRLIDFAKLAVVCEFVCECVLQWVGILSVPSVQVPYNPV